MHEATEEAWAAAYQALATANDNVMLSTWWWSSDFELLRPWFGDTAHVRRLDFDGYPTRDLVGLMKASGYDGWVLLEQGGQPPADLVAALRDQRERFASLVGDE